MLRRDFCNVVVLFVYKVAGSSIESVRCRARLKRDGTRTETRFSLSAKQTSPFKLGGGGEGVSSVDY